MLEPARRISQRIEQPQGPDGELCRGLQLHAWQDEEARFVPVHLTIDYVACMGNYLKNVSCPHTRTARAA